MKKLSVLAILLLMLMALPTLAQEDMDASDGCMTIDGATLTANDTATFGADTFIAGEEIEILVTGTGTEFELQVNSVSESTGNSFDVGLIYTIPADGDYTFDVIVTGADADTTVTFDCLNFDPDADDDDDDDDDDEDNGSVTICHRPPGNPDNAKTLTVGASAVDAHLSNHPDSLGACPREEESEYEDPTTGIVIIILDDTGVIEVYGQCDDFNCDALATIPISDLQPVDGAEYEYDGDPNDGWSVIVYYLGWQDRDGDGESVYVYQINVYLNGELQQDSVLILIDEEGNVDWDSNENPEPIE